MQVIVEGSKPFSAGPGINIDGDKVISVLLRAENNLIKLNSNDELYTDLQFADGLEPEDDLPVGITVGKVLEEDGRDQNGLLINWKTTSGDYARWIYGADGKIYFDGGTGTWTQVYYSSEVDALFTALRDELATVAFSGDYNDLRNRPMIPVVYDGTLTIQKNGTDVGDFTANQQSNKTINITMDKSDVGLSNVDNTSDFDKPISTATQTALDGKQATLVSGTNIKTINNTSILGSGNIDTNQVSDTAYGSSWNGVTDKAPSKNAVYDKINSIDGLIPSAATTSNQLADKNYVNDSINSVTAYYITKNAQGDAFATYAELSSASTYYSGGVARTPTRNDYCIVLADENHSNEVTRYSYQGTQWEYQYTVNESPMSQAQLDALNSGITSTKVGQYDTAVSTIAGYGDIVTHDTSEFATDAQGDLADTAVQPGDLAAVATTGAYSDLSGTPNLATVATSGSYNDLSNKPTIPAAQIQSDWTQSDNTKKDYIKNKPSLATVATSGSYNDLSNKPTIPTDTSDLTNGAGFITGITSGNVTTALGYTPQKQHTTLTLTLTTSGWSSNTQSVTATGVTASNTVFISPAPSSFDDYTSAVIYCSAQGSNSLTFTCTNTPTSNITVNVMILN